MNIVRAIAVSLLVLAVLAAVAGCEEKKGPSTPPGNGGGVNPPPTPEAPTAAGVARAGELAARSCNLAALSALAMENETDVEALRETVRGPLLEAVAAMEVPAAAMLLLNAPFSSRSGKAEESAALVAAWRLQQTRRTAEAETAAAALPDDIGHTWLLRMALAGDDDARCLEAIGRVLIEGAPAASRRLAAGRLLARNGKLDAAEEVLRATDDPRAKGVLALILLANGAGVEAALAEAEAAAAALPDDLVLAHTHLMLLILAGRLDAATDVLAALMPRAEDDPGVQELAGSLRMQRDEPEAAIAAFRRALELDPGSSTSHGNLSILLMARGDRDEALDHLEKALGTISADSFVGTIRDSGEMRVTGARQATARGFVALALRHLARDSSAEQPREHLRRAIELEPGLVSAWIALSELAAREGDGEETVAVLVRGLAANEEGPAHDALAFALATRLLVEGDREGFTETAARIGEDSHEGRLIARLGSGEGECTLVPGRPRPALTYPEERRNTLVGAFTGRKEEVTDVGAVLAAVEKAGGRAFTTAVRTPADAFAAGRTLLLLRLQITERGPRTRFELLVGSDSGLDACLVEEPEPLGTGLLPSREVARGIFFEIVPEGEELPRDPAAESIVEGLASSFSGAVESALAAVRDHRTHPLAAYVVARERMLPSPGPEVLEAIEAALEKDPENPPLRLMLAQVFMGTGDVGRAVQEINRLEETIGDISRFVLVRRLKALALLGGRTIDEGIRELEAIRRDRPDYLPVYEELIGVYLARARFEEALAVLTAFGRRAPEVRTSVKYSRALTVAYKGLASEATTLDDVEPLIVAEDPKIRIVALKTVMRLTREESSAVMARLVADPDLSVRTLAVRFIGRYDHDDLTDAVKKALSDPEPLVRGAAATAWRKLLHMDAARELVRLLDDDEKYVREVALSALHLVSGRDFGFDPAGPAEERTEALRRWQAWDRER